MRAALILLLLAPALPLGAQTVPDTVTETVALAPPVSVETARALQEAGVDTTLAYAASARNVTQPKAPPPPDAPRGPGANVSAFWILGVLAVALLAWLRFGGAGILTRAAPKEGVEVQAPAHWEVNRDLAPASLLDQIAAMEDRSAALVRLLRHCLLRAAEETRTRLARADTEREAFARLPGERPGLRLILQEAELAHYGGRPVTEAAFAAALAEGRRILGGNLG